MFGFGSSGLKDPVSLDGMIFGIPPSTHLSDTIIQNSMPVATIIPCEPEFSSGASLYTLNQHKGWNKYIEILESVGFTIGSSKKIQVSYIADNFPTDTFSNEYGETMFDRMAQGVSSTVGDFSQILGLTDSKDLKNIMSKTPYIGSTINAGVNTVSDMYQGFVNALAESGHERGSQVAKTFGSSISAAATGARIDFPKVWKNSSFVPSYTMTIRLYNPDPGNPEATKKYIVGPIAALLSLSLPKVGNDDVSSYKWPLFCKVISPGIYNLNSSFISNISIIKGGEQQNIAYNQALAICDVRIDFGSLYNSMIAGKGSNKYGDIRPTLGNYLEVLGGKKFSGSDSVVATSNTKEVYKAGRYKSNYVEPDNLYTYGEKAAIVVDRIESATATVAHGLEHASESFLNAMIHSLN